MLLADISGVGRFIVNCLAVAGAFLVGNLLVLGICRLVAKAFFKERMPPLLERALRILGGLALAVLAAFLLFGSGSGGIGGGGGIPGGEGKAPNLPTDKGKEGVPQKTAPATPSDQTVLDRKVTVTVLKATSNPTRFLFPGDTKGIEIADAIKRLDALARESGGHVKIELVMYRDSSGPTNDQVREFLNHANSLKLHPNPIELPESSPE
jgi:hypothetical protein